MRVADAPLEAALPTFGLAGLSAFGLGIVALLSVDSSDAPVWPLLLVVVAVGTWAVSLTLQHQAGRQLQVVAAASRYGDNSGVKATQITATSASATATLTRAMPPSQARLSNTATEYPTE